MSATSLNTAKDILREACKYNGLDRFKIETFHQIQYSEIIVNLSLALSLLDQTQDGIIKTLRQITDDVQNSEAVKDAKYELTQEVEGLNKRVTELKTEVTRLEPFESYYNMTFKMEHGK